MKTRKTDFIILCIGLILIVIGLCLIKISENPEDILRVLPFIFIGLGCGLFGRGMGNIVSKKALKGSPEIAHQLEIEQNDERNIAIANNAKAKAFDMMTFVFGALMVCFALMQIELAATLLLVFTYLLVEGYAIYCRFKIEKIM